MGVVPNYAINNILLEDVREIKDQAVYSDLLLVFSKHRPNCEK